MSDNTLRVLGDTVRRVRDAKNLLREAEKEQARFVLANADELVDRGIVSIRIKEGVLFRQLAEETNRDMKVEKLSVFK